MIRQLLLIGAWLAGATAAANAHSVWIEPKDNELVVRFAEPGSEFETSPGYLDNLTLPVAFTVLTNTPVAVEASKKPDHFQLVGATPASPACVENSFTVRDGRKPIFYARWQPTNGGAATPMLTLDLVPTGKPGEVRAYFRGKPLGGVTATLRKPDGTEQELTADAEGCLHFAAPDPGACLLTIAHYREPLAGFHAGRAYTETSHNCALSWQQAK